MAKKLDTVISDLRRDRALSATTKTVLLALAGYADFDTLRDARPGCRRLMRDTGIRSPNTIYVALARAEAAGWIEQTYKGGSWDGKRTASCYRFRSRSERKTVSYTGTANDRVSSQLTHTPGVREPILLEYTTPSGDQGTAQRAGSSPARSAPPGGVAGSLDDTAGSDDKLGHLDGHEVWRLAGRLLSQAQREQAEAFIAECRRQGWIDGDVLLGGIHLYKPERLWRQRVSELQNWLDGLSRPAWAGQAA